MAERFQNKYRIKSTRLEGWDYRWDAAYFITICTAHRKHYFGEIKNRKMEFAPVGVIADILWHEIPHHASHVQLGNFVVMPNHIHGILILNNPEILQHGHNQAHHDQKKDDLDDNNRIRNEGNEGNDGIEENEGNEENDENAENGNDRNEDVQTLHATSQQHPLKNLKMAKISPKANSISTIIRSYKSATTKHANRLGFEFEWQTRFYDIIIRNDRSFQNISNYIKNNPENWKEDKFH